MSSEDNNKEATNAKITVYPYLSFKGNANEAIEWYGQHLGATVAFKMPYSQGPPPTDEAHKDCVMHASIKIGESTIMLSDVVGEGCGEPVQAGNNVVLNIDWKDGAAMKTAFSAMTEGGRVIMPLEPQFWGATYGQFKDKFDITWSFNCHDAPEAKGSQESSDEQEAKKARTD